MQVLNHLPSPPDAANLLRNYVATKVHTALYAGQQTRQRIKVLDEWLPVQKKWKDILQRSFPEEMLDMRNQPIRAATLRQYQRSGYSIETVLFESLWGWEVNAHLYIPAGKGPFPAVIFPTGHSTKINTHYQLPPTLFALNGFMAITFDSPGQGEKTQGNDHFNQGTACTLTGLWSETFFLMDALRAIDYLAGREDVDMTCGVGMSGVSGGGQTTMMCAGLDDRIRCIAPVCSTGSQRILAAEKFYTSCPETMGKGLFKAGIDLAEALACAAPVPCLIVSGELDEVYEPEVVREFVTQINDIYMLYGMSERFEHYEEIGVGHSYTLKMAEQVLYWMQKWLSKQERTFVPLQDPSACIEPAEVISCHPDSKTNMYSINLARAERLSQERIPASLSQLQNNLKNILGLAETPPPTVRVISGEMTWWHRIDRLAIASEPEIITPALWVTNTDNTFRAKSIVWVDDRGKWEALQKETWLVESTGFLNREGDPQHTYNLCLLDARGWGETNPEHLAYDLAWWNDITRVLAYMSNALDYPLMGQRVRDILATLACLRTLPEVDPDRILLGGRGAGAIAALFAGMIDANIAALILTEMPASFKDIIQIEDFTWSHDIFVPDLLNHFDLPDLLDAIECPVLNINPVDGKRMPVHPPADPPVKWLETLKL